MIGKLFQLKGTESIKVRVTGIETSVLYYDSHSNRHLKTDEKSFLNSFEPCEEKFSLSLKQIEELGVIFNESDDEEDWIKQRDEYLALIIKEQMSNAD